MKVKINPTVPALPCTAVIYSCATESGKLVKSKFHKSERRIFHTQNITRSKCFGGCSISTTQVSLSLQHKRYVAYSILTKKEIKIENFAPYWRTETVFAFYQFS